MSVSFIQAVNIRKFDTGIKESSISFIQPVNIRKFDTLDTLPHKRKLREKWGSWQCRYGPEATTLPLPPEEWTEKELSMDYLKKQILKKIHKLIRTYPGRHSTNQISKTLDLDFDSSDEGHKGYTAMRATNELIKNGYIRQTSAGGFIAIKPFA